MLFTIHQHELAIRLQNIFIKHRTGQRAKPKPKQKTLYHQTGYNPLGCPLAFKLNSTSVFLEKEVATHFNILAWRSPWAEESGRLQSKGSQRVRHDWATITHSFCCFRVLWSKDIHIDFIILFPSKSKWTSHPEVLWWFMDTSQGTMVCRCFEAISNGNPSW